MSETEPPPAVAPPPGGKTPKIVLALLVLNLGASGFATFKLVTAKPAEAAHAPEHEEPKTLEVTGPVVALDPFVVNLDEPGTARYLKITIQIELTGHEAEPAIEKSKQLIRDTILSHLSGLHVKDTLGASAKDTIRTDLQASVEKVVGTGKVRRVFFQEFVVQ